MIGQKFGMEGKRLEGLCVNGRFYIGLNEGWEGNLVVYFLLIADFYRR